jgi:hypothetical protein
MNLVDINRVFFLPSSNTILFFLAALRTFTKVDHILGYKASLTKYKKIKTISCILSDHNGIKVELNNKRKNRKYSHTWRLNNTLLYDQWTTKEIREEFKKF